MELKSECHTLGSGPGAPVTLGSPAQRKHFATDCYSWATPATWWNGSGNSGRDSKPCSSGTEAAGLGTFPTLAHREPGTPQKIRQRPASATETQVQVQEPAKQDSPIPKSSHRILAGLDPQKGFAPSMNEVVPASPTPSYAHLDSRKAYCWLSFGG